MARPLRHFQPVADLPVDGIVLVVYLDDLVPRRGFFNNLYAGTGEVLRKPDEQPAVAFLDEELGVAVQEVYPDGRVLFEIEVGVTDEGE